MTTTPNHQPLSLERAEDVLAYIPHALGFHPQCSVVLLLMIHHKLEATLRVDLPQGDEPEQLAEWVQQVCELISKLPGLTDVLCVLYPVDRVTSGEQLPWEPLLIQLDRELECRKTPLRQAWCHSAGQIWDYLSLAADHGCLEVASPELTPTSLRMVVAGSAPLTEPWDGQGVPVWDNADEVRALIGELDGDFLDSLDTWAMVLSAEPYKAEQMIRHNPTVTARLLWGLRVRMVRDVLPYLAGVGSADAVEVLQALDQEPPGEQVGKLADFLLGKGAQCPQWGRIDRLWFICRDLLGVAQGDVKVALLCLLAWIEWAKGRGSMSMALLRGALEIEPNYRLAQLLQQLLQRGIMPQWVTDPRRAWRAKFE